MLISSYSAASAAHSSQAFGQFSVVSLPGVYLLTVLILVELLSVLDHAHLQAVELFPCLHFSVLLDQLGLLEQPFNLVSFDVLDQHLVSFDALLVDIFRRVVAL